MREVCIFQLTLDCDPLTNVAKMTPKYNDFETSYNRTKMPYKHKKRTIALYWVNYRSDVVMRPVMSLFKNHWNQWSVRFQSVCKLRLIAVI